MRAHVIALVLDAEEVCIHTYYSCSLHNCENRERKSQDASRMFCICNLQIIKAKCSMTHSEVVIARRAVEEGRGLVVIVNKMDRLRGRENSEMYKKIKEAVPIEIQTVIPQVIEKIASFVNSRFFLSFFGFPGSNIIYGCR